jgi:hypothetical protein
MFREYTSLEQACLSTARRCLLSEQVSVAESICWAASCCRIVFRNTCRFPTTIHVHGLRYNKTSEGAGYNDGTSGAAKGDDGVPTGDDPPHGGVPTSNRWQGRTGMPRDLVTFLPLRSDMSC